MKIFEILQATPSTDSMSVKWLYDGTTGSKKGIFVVNGEEYIIAFYKNELRTSVSFRHAHSGLERTFTHDALQVFKTVLSIISDYINTEKPNVIWCYANDAKLGSFYSKLFGKLAGRFTEYSYYGNGDKFVLTRKDVHEN